MNPHPDAHLTIKLQRLPIASASVIVPGSLPIAQGDKTITLVAGIVVHFMCANIYCCISLSLQLWEVYYPHVTGEETEAQKAEAICPQFRKNRVAGLEFKPRQSDPRIHAASY